jgi:hypothetical protein
VEAPDEMQELKEHAEEAHKRGMLEVSMTMAVLAVIIALLTMLGHRTHNEEVVIQDQATDQWNYYQAKKTQLLTAQSTVDTSEMFREDPGHRGEKARANIEKYGAIVEKNSDKQKDIDAEARKLEAEVKLQAERATRFDYGESLVAIALVITSITLMTSRRAFWLVGIVVACLGTLVGLSAFLLH